MPVPWIKRKEKMRIYEERNKNEGRLPYWNDRARYSNYRAKKEYGCTEIVIGKELKDLYDLANKRCYLCGYTLTPSEVVFDHIDPLNNGGQHHISNIGITCLTCNAAKGKTDPDTFLSTVYNTGQPEPIYNFLYYKEAIPE